MQLPIFIAKRYLFAKKSHNVINIISLISAAGIAIGTAALIVILSVYNGFEGLIMSLNDVHESDLLITPVKGKTFVPQGERWDSLRKDKAILYLSEIVEENVFVKYGDQESIATIRGVDSTYEENTGLNKYIKEGKFSLYHGEVPQAILGRSLAYHLGLRVHFTDPLELYFPSRNRSFSMVNPASSLNNEKLFPSGIFALEQGFDKKYIFVPISVARNLLEYENEVTAIELSLKDKDEVQRFKKELRKTLAEDYLVRDRYEQNETLYKMMKSEKLSIYIILLFVLVIISCNLFGSLSMLIIEKREDAATFKAMGARDTLIKRIFLTEGWMISLLGVAAGTVTGLLLCFIQQTFGVIPMPGNFIIENYPVVVKSSDVIITVCGIALIGFLAARLPLTIVKKIENF